MITRDRHLTSLNDGRLQTMLLLLSKNLFLSRYPNYIEQMFSLIDLLIRSVTENGLQDINILTPPKPRTTTHGLNSFTCIILCKTAIFPPRQNTNLYGNEYIYCYGQKCFSSLFIYSYAMTLTYNMYNIIGDELLLNFGAKFQRYFVISHVKLQNRHGNPSVRLNVKMATKF